MIWDKKILFKALYTYIYIIIVMGVPAGSHSPGAQCILNAGPDESVKLINESVIINTFYN